MTAIKVVKKQHSQKINVRKRVPKKIPVKYIPSDGGGR